MTRLTAEPGTRAKYEGKLKEFQSWRAAIMAGALDQEHADWPKYLELKQWMRDNFTADYVDMF